ncbi:MAG: LacI family DNA-binding transcriptional regulator [Pseudothermotoga sp.]
MKKLTIKDIAQMAEVSISTVSRVLNQKSNVDPQLRERVMQVIKDTGFQPSSFARLFRKSHAQVGAVLNGWEENYLSVLQGIVEQLYQKGILVNLKANLDSSADPVVVISERFKDQVKASLLVGYDSMSCSVTFNHSSAMNSIVERMLKYNARSFAFLCEDLANYKSYMLYTSFMKAMFNHKIENYDVRVLKKPQESYDATKSLSTLPNVILCSSDHIAVGVLKSLKDEGIKVPDQVSVFGYGNLSFCDFLDPPLSSVEYMNKEVGKICADLLMKLINGEEIPKRIVLETNLVKRQSSL